MSTVKEYYNTFSKEVLLKDFRDINLRHESLRKFCRKELRKNSNILEIGCGVGIITKELLKYSSRLISLDISSKNIEIAQKYTGLNAVFKCADILSAGIHELLDPPYDFIILFDVIEHIPKKEWINLFSVLNSLLEEQGKILISIPSPEYQTYLSENDPGKLQIVDEIVTLKDFTDQDGFTLTYLSYESIWYSNQYIHLTISKNVSLKKNSIKGNFLKNIMWHMRNYIFLRKVS